MSRTLTILQCIPRRLWVFAEPVVDESAQRIQRLEVKNQRLRTLLRQTTADLHARISAEYQGVTETSPLMRHKEMDMEVVNEALAEMRTYMGDEL